MLNYLITVAKTALKVYLPKHIPPKTAPTANPAKLSVRYMAAVTTPPTNPARPKHSTVLTLSLLAVMLKSNRPNKLAAPKNDISSDALVLSMPD